jgi:hypothetical protein
MLDPRLPTGRPAGVYPVESRGGDDNRIASPTRLSHDAVFHLWGCISYDCDAVRSAVRVV